MKLQTSHFEVGDTGPGYWISKDGTTVIVGAQKRDGSFAAYMIKQIPNQDGKLGYSWSEPVRLGR